MICCQAASTVSHTSELAAITKPSRWKYERVDVWSWGSQRATVQTCVRGDFLRDLGTGEVFEFVSRLGDELCLIPLNDEPTEE